MASPTEDERSFEGQVASPGLAVGPVARVGAVAVRTAAVGTPEAERRHLQCAMAEAAADLAALVESQDDDEAAAILEFQLAMLEDDTLSAPAFEEIETGSPADEAWRRALGAQIADYVAADDPYFRARAADLVDLRDRVLLGFAGGGEGGDALPPDAILLGTDLTPSRFLEIDWRRCGGIALSEGSTTSHVAMLARARAVPMVVGLGSLDAEDGTKAVLDAEAGTLVTRPCAVRLAEAEARRASLAERRAAEERLLPEPATTADGERVTVLVNVADPSELDALDPGHCDGIGLVRTELLFHGVAGLPDEEAQAAAYRRVLSWAGERPVTVRTLDAGGDKPIPGLTVDGEANPFLGVRGLRLSLRRPEVFRVQLRALARAAPSGNLKVMLPMVTVPAELEAARALFAAEVDGLRRQGVAAEMPPLGIMVEVPSAAIAIADFDAAFASIGSNDLVQYVTACGRDTSALADLCDPLNPAVLELIRRVAAHGRTQGIEISVCGDMAGDPSCVSALLDCGIHTLSVAPAALGRTKAAVAAHGRGGRG